MNKEKRSCKMKKRLSTNGIKTKNEIK